ncbi:MAG: glycine hydroxymethyltransferase, partial [Nitrospinota bacterium]|nr:glycine hydroxymethyltransferase [Nitrospinota bacterium]
MTNSITGSRLARYINALEGKTPNTGAAAYYASLDQVESVSPNIANSIAQELEDQRSNIKLIASENYCSLATQLAHGNLLTDKYAEGFANHRFYAGCDNVDQIESEACDLARELFGADHAYVQPHSGVDANFTALFAVLFARVRQPYIDKTGKKALDLDREEWTGLNAEMNRQKIMGMDYFSGGHLTHGYRFNIISNMMDVYTYSVDRNTHLLDYDGIY